MPNDTLSLFAPTKDWVRVADDDFTDGEMRGVEFGDFGLCLAKIDGQYRAIEDSCNHSGALLSGGRLDGAIVTCPRHFLRFSMVDGALQTKPKICDPQRVYEVKVEDGGVFIAKVGSA